MYLCSNSNILAQSAAHILVSLASNLIQIQGWICPYSDVSSVSIFLSRVSIKSHCSTKYCKNSHGISIKPMAKFVVEGRGGTKNALTVSNVKMRLMYRWLGPPILEYPSWVHLYSLPSQTQYEHLYYQHLSMTYHHALLRLKAP